MRIPFRIPVFIILSVAITLAICFYVLNMDIEQHKVFVVGMVVCLTALLEVAYQLIQVLNKDNDDHPWMGI